MRADRHVPRLDRALVCTNAGPLILLEGYQTPADIRRVGIARPTRWLRGRGARSPQCTAIIP
ncbi:hypothetical protein GCM10010166_61810 [Couchioplanes caeruleus subsp. azureus]|nr:hypothetical protein GCM10010166_61810 [Couchioplanes caeruleus subsp. azureus]